MSFSSLVKHELCRNAFSNDCCLSSELAAVIRLSGTVGCRDLNDVNLSISTENAAFARSLFTLLGKLYHIIPEVIIRKSKKLKKHTIYILVITASKGAKQILNDCGIKTNCAEDFGTIETNEKIRNIFKKSCCRKAYLRGAFLAAGSVSDPEKTYHLEISGKTINHAIELVRVINSFNLNAKVISRKGNYVAYLKEGENIVDFFNIVGAHKALLELENVRILKEMRNNVNRIVNCETANLDKTVTASMRQVENIRYIKDKMGFDHLPDSLRQIAELRLEYADANLTELGEMLNPPLGKSGVNHRLRKLDMIAENEKAVKAH